MGWIRKLGPVGPMAVLATLAPPLSGLLLLGTLNHVGPWLRAHQEWGAAIYVAGFAVLGGLALLPTHAPSVLAGWAFGVVSGVPLALAGFLGASLLGYGLAHRISGDRVEALLAQHARWRAVYAALVRSGFWRGVLIVFLLRLPPNAPFAASNLAMAGLRVPVAPYGLGTLLGLAPKTSAMVVAGASVSVLDLSNRAQTGWFAAGLALTFVALGALGVLARAALRRVEREATGAPAPAGAPDAIVLYDGVCHLCNGTVRFIVARDPSARVAFAPLQSGVARRLLAEHALSAPAAGDPASVVLVEGGRAWTRSTAVLRIARHLAAPWPALSVFLLVPRVVRDAVYDWVARHRYGWFGRSATCEVPGPEVRRRLLDDTRS